MATPLTPAEFAALGEIAKARRQLVTNMFTGTKLKFGGKAKTTKDLLESGKDVAMEAKKLVKTSSTFLGAATDAVKKTAEEFIKDCAGVESIAEVVEAITGETVAQIITEITPFVGIVTSSVKLAKAAKTVADDAYNLYKSDYYMGGFRPGDPVAACMAVQRIIKADLARHSIELGQQSVATGAKIAGLFADLGTTTTAAIGLGNALATLGLKLALLGVDIRYMVKGNQRLKTPNTLNLDVFNECPILGCYLLTCADTSLVANFFVADIGLPGWMDKVEHMKKQQMDPLLKIATKAIKESRLQLDGLSQNKGTHVKKDFFASIKAKALKKVGIGK